MAETTGQMGRMSQTGQQEEWDVPDCHVPMHGDFPKPFRGAQINQKLIVLQRPDARAALKKRRLRLLGIGEAIKAQKIPVAEVARQLGKSTSRIYGILRGGYPFENAWEMPRYFEEWAINRSFAKAHVKGDGLYPPPLAHYLPTALREDEG